MPPKTTKTAGDAAEGDKGSGRFRWTPELDLKLLYLMTVPRQVSVKEHAELATALGIPTPGGVRNRIDKLRTDHRKVNEEFGITVPGSQAVPKDAGKPDDGSATKAKSNKPAPVNGGKKRASKKISGAEDEDLGGAKKVKKEEHDDLNLDGDFDGIKSEGGEDDI